MARLDPLEKTLAVAAVLAAVVWLVADLRAAGGAGGALLAAKAAPATLLAAIAAGRRSAPRDGLLAVALVLHAAGDLLLELSLLAGLAAFLLGHLAYVALFWPARRGIDELGGAVKLGWGALALVGATFLVLLAGRLDGALAAAVPVYVLALLAMAGSALASSRGQPLVAAGGLLFVASDALLAVELFLDPGGAAPRALVWPLYVAAQLALALGWIGGARPAAAAGAERVA